MSEYFTDDDVTKVAALLGDWFGHEGPTQRGDARDFLDEIAPAIAARAQEAGLAQGGAAAGAAYRDGYLTGKRDARLSDAAAVRPRFEHSLLTSQECEWVEDWLQGRAEGVTDE